MERWPDDWSIPEGQELKDLAEFDPFFLALCGEDPDEDLFA